VNNIQRAVRGKFASDMIFVLFGSGSRVYLLFDEETCEEKAKGKSS
jgi:hypothetical protein